MSVNINKMFVFLKKNLSYLWYINIDNNILYRIKANIERKTKNYSYFIQECTNKIFREKTYFLKDNVENIYLYISEKLYLNIKIF